MPDKKLCAVLLGNRSVIIDGETYHITLAEVGILEYLLAHRGQWCSIEAIVRYAWGNDINGGPSSERSSVGVHIHHIRKKLWYGFIDGSHSHGYRLPLNPLAQRHHVSPYKPRGGQPVPLSQKIDNRAAAGA
ncbi:MAG: winged helix-turn-helix transcriptional regulator [Alphaproteobacteria bacterium]|nr:winged helix-turn-helix transcriptional regulator [Alphaproteobacteria bacterium]